MLNIKKQKAYSQKTITSIKQYNQSSQQFSNNEDLWQLKKQKGNLKNKIKESKVLLSSIIEEYNHYSIKTNHREEDIRDYISNLDYINNKHIDKSKELINGLIDDISINICSITEKIKFEIEETRKDIENRINIRIMDSEFTHRQLLERKIKEQEKFMKLLHSFTAIIVGIQKNYNRSKDEIRNLLILNKDLKGKIEKVKTCKNELIEEMMRIKEVLSNIKHEIYLCVENNKVNLNIKDLKRKYENDDKENYIKKENSIKDVNDEKYNTIKSYIPIINNKNYKLNRIGKSINSNISQSIKSPYSTFSLNINQSLNAGINHANTASRTASNFNCIYKKRQIENKYIINKLDEIGITKENRLISILYKIVNYIKEKGKLNKTNQIYADKDVRRRFISNLCDNEEIRIIYKNFELPSIVLSNRKINMVNSFVTCMKSRDMSFIKKKEIIKEQINQSSNEK